MVSSEAVHAVVVVCSVPQEPQLGQVLEDVPATEKVPVVHEAKTASAVAEQAEVVLCPALTVEQDEHVEDVSAVLEVRYVEPDVQVVHVGSGEVLSCE